MAGAEKYAFGAGLIIISTGGNMLKAKAVNLDNITVNGVPLKVVIDEAVGTEIRTHHADEVRELNFVKRIHIPSAAFRNHSGARSGKGRVIFHRG